MSSLSRPPFSCHDFACSNFSFLIKAKFVTVVTLTCLETELPVATSIFSRDFNSAAG